MKTIIKVHYRKAGVQYYHILPNMPNGSIESAMLKLGIGRFDILGFQREQVRI